MQVVSSNARPARDRLAAPVKAVSLILLCLPLVACVRNGELTSDITQAFELAFSTDDIEACMALIADDAQVLPEYGPAVTDRASIEKFFKDQMGPVIAFDTTSEMSLVRGDLAIEQGQFKVRDVRRGSNVELGKYLHVWKKQRGEWKLFRIIYNADVAPKGEVSVEPAEPEGMAAA